MIWVLPSFLNLLFSNYNVSSIHDEFNSMNMEALPLSEQSDLTKKITNSQNYLFDQSFLFTALVLSISIAISVILFARRSWLNLKVYNQNYHI